MSENLYIVEVSNLSPNTTERDLYDFFSFSGVIEHIEIIRLGDYGSTGYVTFKEPHALETAVLLSGATIIDQQVCISRWGHNEESSSFWEQHSWRLDDDDETMRHADLFTTTPREAINITQEVVKTMLAKGYILGKDALQKAKAFDESYQVSSRAASKAADVSQRIGLTDKINAGLDAVLAVDERYHVREATKTVVSATGRAAAAVGSSIINSSYFSAGALWVSDALSRAAKAAAELSERGARN
ncbi:binding partner of ACD11 1 [Phalaenopsis equestris]|uniref:binding partner of ACD11 1 n=1 Tax=Phalaenopsis equestris TaxID=78828 RepID=UPI0009E1B306|nr:binding partner of ACD11 1 [Phalaenopsis equestris]XP_020583259.1 binding partner of ACD11 1 [Phalaenopsis equestris]